MIDVKDIFNGIWDIHGVGISVAGGEVVQGIIFAETCAPLALIIIGPLCHPADRRAGWLPVKNAR